MPERKINGGSPIGPGFVVYERAEGKRGYDLEMAKRSVGKGWARLLEQLFLHLERNPGPAVIQVKEKFGGLRVYLDEGNEYTEGIVSGLEMASYTICEACGQPGQLRTKRSWILTLCDECHKKPRPMEG